MKTENLPKVELDTSFINIALANLLGWKEEDLFKDGDKIYVSYDKGQNLHEFSYEDPTVLTAVCQKFNKWPEKHDENQWICKVEGPKSVIILSEDKDYAVALAIALEFFA